ncbi:alpha/beta fold hydrolase [Balneatrix alpica]|uniref:alpha/beta fold hydrolase n=1 Tax=Balneatrix alpica TaxID=75684 RepID=UPI00273846B5|nr:alpha/beta hydrolase [Balneatrix alpica]
MLLPEHIGVMQWGRPGDTPVLALHGWLDNAASFAPLAEYLCQHYPIHFVAMDLAGHGCSAWRQHGHYYVWGYCQEVRELVEALAWRRFHLLGHSLGAGVATLFAAAYPQTLASLLLIEGLGPVSAAVPNFVHHLPKVKKVASSAPSSREFDSIEQAIAVRMRGMWPLSANAAKPLVERALRKMESGCWQWRTDPRLKAPSPLRLTETQVRHYLAQLPMPVRLLWGEEGILPKWPQLDERKLLLAQMEETTLPGGHHLHLDEQVVASAQWLAAQLGVSAYAPARVQQVHPAGI